MKDLVKKASEFASKAHENQPRKGGGPYIQHPNFVASLLEANHATPELVAAGFLHDVVEDTSYKIEDIEKQFGRKVKELVESNTEDKTLSWEERKTHTIHQLVFSTLEERMLLIADKYANLVELDKQLGLEGEKTWDIFNRGKELQRWYFSSIALSMAINLDETPPALFEQYRQLVNKVFDINI